MTQVLRLPAVLSRIGVSRSTLYLWCSEGRFPASIPLGERSIGWLESEVTAWIEGEGSPSARHRRVRSRRGPRGLTPIVSAPRWPGREVLSMGGAGLPVAGFDTQPRRVRVPSCPSFTTAERAVRWRILHHIDAEKRATGTVVSPPDRAGVRGVAALGAALAPHLRTESPNHRGAARGGPMTPGRVPIDFPSLADPVARALLGDPNPKLSTAAELRYGEHGRLSVRLAGERAGQWYDFRDGRGGGVLDLVIHEHQASDRAGAVRWLEAEGFTDPVRARESAATVCPGMTACGGAGEGRATAYRQSSQSSRRASARRLWESTRPIAGTVAEALSRPRAAVGHVSESSGASLPSRACTHRNAHGRLPRGGGSRVAGRRRRDSGWGASDVHPGGTGPGRRTLTRPRRCSARVAAARYGSLRCSTMRCLSARASNRRPPPCGCSIGRVAHGQRSRLRDCAPSCSPHPCGAWWWLQIGIARVPGRRRRRSSPTVSRPKGAASKSGSPRPLGMTSATN